MPGQPDIPDHPTRSTVRERCQQGILALLGNMGGRTTFDKLLGVYHEYYRAQAANGGKNVYERRDLASSFLRRMENEGLISCTYNADGIVLEAVLKAI